MLTPRQKNKSKGLPERAAPFLGNREEVGGKPPLSMRAQCPCFRSPFCSVTLPGTGGAVTIRRRFPCGIGCGHCPQGSLAKGSWHAGGVTEGFTVGASPKAQANVKWHRLIAPSGRELSPQVTEGASGRRSSGFIMGRYLLETFHTPYSTAVTIPGTGGAVTILK